MSKTDYTREKLAPGGRFRLSIAQADALFWLPADGSWRLSENRAAPGLRSLLTDFPKLVTRDLEYPAKGSGYYKVRAKYRLTEFGQAERALRLGIQEQQAA